MQIAFSCLGIAVFIAALGCQPQAKKDISIKPELEPSTIVRSEPTEPAGAAEQSGEESSKWADLAH